MLNVLNVRRVSVIQTSNGRRKAEMLTSGLVEATDRLLDVTKFGCLVVQSTHTHTTTRVLYLLEINGMRNISVPFS